MNEKKKRKRRHDNESDGRSSEGEPKSRKIARKSSRTQLDEKKRDKNKSKHERPNTSERRSTSGSDSSENRRHKKKRKERKDSDRKNKQRRKKEKRKRRHEKGKRRKGSDEEKADVKRVEKDTTSENTDGTRGDKSISPPSYHLGAVPAPKKRLMVPMTKEEYEKQQAQVRRVYDPETGRHRLIKGTGEVLEEIVSRERHKAINKTATQGDGAFFQANLGLGDK